MRKPGSIKLLTKTTFIYLIFTFIAFFSSGLFLGKKADQFIDRLLEYGFDRYQRHIINNLSEGKDLTEKFSSGMLALIDAPADSGLYPVYSDTLIYNNELAEMHRFRKRKTVFEVNGQYYRLTLKKQLHDFYILKGDIFGALIPAFILLALSVVFFNYLLSGYYFKPFNKILGLMKDYKIGQVDGRPIKEVKTNTSEFIRMQQLYLEMIDQIEKDYRNLKEYTENMAHEMQTPLTIIRNKTENLIADENVMHQQAGTVKILYDEVNHLSKLGNTLNLLTKIENGEFSDALVVKTRPVIEKHVEAIRELAQLKSLRLEVDLSEDHQILIDPFLFDIVLKNLLRNAVHYGTPDGPIRIQTSQNSFSVSNYGKALDIPPEKLFERFFGKSGSRTSLGLGLSLVKKICELNGLSVNYIFRDNQHIFSLDKNAEQ